MHYLKLIILLIGILLQGCGHAPVEEPKQVKEAEPNPHYPITIQNYGSDRKKIPITFKNEPQRIVTDHQNIMEALMAIDKEDSIVAASYAGTDTRIFSGPYKEKAKKLDISNYRMDLETVLMSKPDCIIGWQSTFGPRMLQSTYYWQGRNVNTYIAANSNTILPVGRIEDEYHFLQDLGKIFDKEKQMNQLVQDIDAEIKYVYQQTQQLPKQKVLILEFLGGRIITYGKNRLAGDMVTRLGGELIPCGVTIDAETLLTLNPDVIFIVATRGLENKAIYTDKIYKNESFRSLKAVRNRRVYAMPLIFMYVSGTRTLDGIKAFRDGLYPELKKRGVN